MCIKPAKDAIRGYTPSNHLVQTYFERWELIDEQKYGGDRVIVFLLEEVFPFIIYTNLLWIRARPWLLLASMFCHHSCFRKLTNLVQTLG